MCKCIRLSSLCIHLPAVFIFGFDGDCYIHLSAVLVCCHCVQVGCVADMALKQPFFLTVPCALVLSAWNEHKLLQTPPSYVWTHAYITQLHPDPSHFSPEEEGTLFNWNVTHLHLLAAHKNVLSSWWVFLL